MAEHPPKEFARAWFAAGQTADFVCETCGASTIDFPEKCNAALDVVCSGLLALYKAFAKFETHLERRTK